MGRPKITDYRLRVPLTSAMEQELRRISKATGEPMSIVVRDLLQTALPSLGRVADLLEQAKESQQGFGPEFMSKVEQLEQGLRATFTEFVSE